MQHITWTLGRYGILHGTVGQAELFTISASTRLDERYQLDTQLPGLRRTRSFATEDDAKQAAEQTLDQFVRELGATWK